MTVDDWARSEAIPFDVASSKSFDSAVDQTVGAMSESVELLGLGEAMHGAPEFLVLRNRLFQRLVKAHGFTAIAVESSFPRGRVVNEYVTSAGSNGGPATYDDVADAGFSHGFGRLAENRELVEWMRQYNAQPAHGAKLHFYGFDSPTEMMWSDSPRRLLEFVLEYLGLMGGENEGRRGRIAGLLGEDTAWENQEAAFDPAKSIGLSPGASALRIEVEELVSELNVRRPELMAVRDGGRYLEAVQNAALARQLLNYHAAVARTSEKRIAQLLGMRDSMMADNLAYIVARERGRGRVLAFAHNSHLKRGNAQWQLGADLLEWWPAGAHLGAMMGGRYAVIGSGVGMSEAHGIRPPESGTLESHLTTAPGPARFIPTSRAQSLEAEMEAVLPTRASSSKNSSYFPLTSKSLAEFDWLAVLDSIA
jgi:erythromycin esterase